MNELVVAALRDLLESARIDEAHASAQDAWVRTQLGVGTRWSIPEDVITVGHQVAILSPDVPPSIDEIPDDVRQRLETLAASVDIASRVEPSRARELSKLSANLYLAAQQPTRAVHAVRRLARIEPEDAQAGRLYRLLESAYRMTGVQSIEVTTEAASREVFAEPGHRFLEALSATAWNPEAFRVLREADVALRYRAAHDLRGIAGGRLPNAFLTRAYDGPRWSRRQELLPSQAAVVRAGLLDEDRSLVSTTTGTGKTFLAELMIATTLHDEPNALVAYVAPLNALARQVQRDLQRRLGTVGQVTLWTGAYEIDDGVTDLGNVLVTTPEKLDAVLRLGLTDDPRSRDLLDRLRLVIADEVHQVSDGSRGLRYEFVLLRLKKRLERLRLLALSAVQTDADPFVRFLGRPGEPAAVHRVAWSASTVVDLLWSMSGELLTRNAINEEPPRLPRPRALKAAAASAAATLLERAESVLLVESRRDWAESLAAEIFDSYREYLDRRLAANSAADGVAQLEDLSTEVESRLYSGHPLARYIRSGLAFHHAGLPPSLRRRIEELAARGLVHTVVSTTTRAEGVDLPFRAVVLCRLALPFGRPFRASRIRNIRGRAARPSYASDGLFVVLEPENRDTAAYQYFIDHYWDETVETVEPPSAVADLLSLEPIRQQPALRCLEGQLLAYFSEHEVELPDAGRIANETLFAQATGVSQTELSRVVAGVQRVTERMLEEPALLKVASPISPTAFGRAAILGGMSAASARLVRQALLANIEVVAAMIESDAVLELAVRLAWLPWEAVEATDQYRNTVSRRRRFERDVNRLPGLIDQRLATHYDRSRDLLSQRSLQDLATDGDSSAPSAVNERLAGLVKWGGRFSGLLPWTLTGVLRIVESMTEEVTPLSAVASAVGPYAQFMGAWVSAPGGAELVRRGQLDRDSALRLLEASSLWDAPAYELVDWVGANRTHAIELVGEREVFGLLGEGGEYEDRDDPFGDA